VPKAMVRLPTVFRAERRRSGFDMNESRLIGFRDQIKHPFRRPAKRNPLNGHHNGAVDQDWIGDHGLQKGGFRNIGVSQTQSLSLCAADAQQAMKPFTASGRQGGEQGFGPTDFRYSTTTGSSPRSLSRARVLREVPQFGL